MKWPGVKMHKVLLKQMHKVGYPVSVVAPPHPLGTRRRASAECNLKYFQNGRGAAHRQHKQSQRPHSNNNNPSYATQKSILSAWAQCSSLCPRRLQENAQREERVSRLLHPLGLKEAGHWMRKLSILLGHAQALSTQVATVTLPRYIHFHLHSY
jgi:hypothetical protein